MELLIDLKQMMRLDFVQRQRAWEAELARAAPSVGEEDVMENGDQEEEDEGDVFGGLGSSGGDAMQFSAPGSQQQQQWGWQATQEEADEVAEREREELDALLSLLPVDEMQGAQEQAQGQQPSFGSNEEQQGDEQMSEHFGSDDDDYDALFSDFINADAHETVGGFDQAQVPEAGGEAMDMS